MRYLGVTVVRHERNSGLAAARNTAFRVARGGFVASLDADCVAEPASVEKLAARMNDARIAGAGGFLREGVQAAIADRRRAAHLPQEWGATLVPNPKFLFGCNTIFRPAAVPDAGGYDETMRSSGEDGELSRQFYGKRCQALFVHFRHAFLELFIRDLRARRFELLLLMCAFSPAFLIGIFGLWPPNGKLLNESAAGA